MTVLNLKSDLVPAMSRAMMMPGHVFASFFML